MPIQMVINMNRINQGNDYLYLNVSDVDNLENNKNYIINDNILDDELVLDIPDGFVLKFYVLPTKKIINLKVIQNNNSDVEVYFSILGDDNKCHNIKNNIIGSNNKTLVKGRVLSDLSDVSLTVEGEIFKGTLNNVYTEDIKGLNLNNGFIKIVPNLLVSTDNVLANHLVSISDIRKDEVNYLMQKGISYNVARDILINTFINNMYPDDIKNNIAWR